MWNKVYSTNYAQEKPFTMLKIHTERAFLPKMREKIISSLFLSFLCKIITYKLSQIISFIEGKYAWLAFCRCEFIRTMKIDVCE